MHPGVIFTANRNFALMSSREGIIRHFLSPVWKVVPATADDVHSHELVALGAEPGPSRFIHGGIAPLAEFWAWQRMGQIVRRHRPPFADRAGSPDRAERRP